jgi:hypothetical protein
LQEYFQLNPNLNATTKTKLTELIFTGLSDKIWKRECKVTCNLLKLLYKVGITTWYNFQRKYAKKVTTVFFTLT